MEAVHRREESFELFERAAAKGHEESIWILNVVKDVEMDWDVWKEAIAKTEEPLGWYLAGYLSGGRERFEFWKKSAEGGCSWGQVGYGWYFRRGEFVEKDLKVYVEWLEKAVKQNNPYAMYYLGRWFRDEGGDMKKVRSYFRAASEMGWKTSMYWLANVFKNDVKDLRQAAIWSAKGNIVYVFWETLGNARRALESRRTDDLGCDFDQLCFSLGWGLYWYQYGSENWNKQSDEDQAFGNTCLDYYCSCVELQQKSIFTFLLCWNRTTGVKGPGQMIGNMVWKGREDNLVQNFAPIGEKEPEMKRIKK
jgi:hypothetical protein